MKLLGLDHADIRVPSLALVERFEDAVLPSRGLSPKLNRTLPMTASAGCFIEAARTMPTATRIAIILDDERSLEAVQLLVCESGGCIVERSADTTYPAIFFEDPAGTRLEICARRPRT